MSNNIFVSYDLIKPDKNYDAVIAAIKAVSGQWAKVHYSYWYVKTTLTASQVYERIKSSFDANDRVLVIDATNNTAIWVNLDPKVSDYLKNNWYI
jgi:hypothetical protein